MTPIQVSEMIAAGPTIEDWASVDSVGKRAMDAIEAPSRVLIGAGD